MCHVLCYSCLFFFFNDTATTEIYTLSLHDALPISRSGSSSRTRGRTTRRAGSCSRTTCSTCSPERSASSVSTADRKSTRLNSSHANISYAVFCLKKKKNKMYHVRSHVKCLNTYVYT